MNRKTRPLIYQRVSFSCFLFLHLFFSELCKVMITICLIVLSKEYIFIYSSISILYEINIYREFIMPSVCICLIVDVLHRDRNHTYKSDMNVIRAMKCNVPNHKTFILFNWFRLILFIIDWSLSSGLVIYLLKARSLFEWFNYCIE